MSGNDSHQGFSLITGFLAVPVPRVSIVLQAIILTTNPGRPCGAAEMLRASKDKLESSLSQRPPSGATVIETVITSHVLLFDRRICFCGLSLWPDGERKGTLYMPIGRTLHTWRWISSRIASLLVSTRSPLPCFADIFVFRYVSFDPRFLRV